LERIVGRQRTEDNPRLGPRDGNNLFGKLSDREFRRVAKVQRTGESPSGWIVGVLHESNDGIHQVVDVAEAARLGAVPIKGNVHPAKRLYDEITNDAPIVRMHPRSIRVEDP